MKLVSMILTWRKNVDQLQQFQTKRLFGVEHFISEIDEFLTLEMAVHLTQCQLDIHQVEVVRM